jgi:hypothetical protein
LYVAARLAPAADLYMPEHPLRSIQTETLVYGVRASKGFVTFDLGTATFVLTRESVKGQPQLVVRATAKGGVVGYQYDAVTTCRLRLDTLEELGCVEYRVKPDYKSKWLRFHERGIDYLKHKTCDVPALCRNPAHFITNVGNARVHIRESEDPAHHVWSLRERHRRVEGRVYDAFGALYLARGFDASVGGSGGTIRVVSKRDMWDIRFRGKAEETLEVPAGTIRCIRLALKTKPANAYSRKHSDEFEGPFGLHGAIDLYVDQETNQAVLVRGQVELGAVFDVEVRLKSRAVTPLSNAADQ